MPNFDVGGIDVVAEPSFRGFSRKLREGLVEEERRAPDIQVEVEPRLEKAFRRTLATLVKEASAGVTVEVEATPGLQRGFRTQLAKLVREAAVGVTVPVNADPQIGANFRRELVRLVAAASAGVSVGVEMTPELTAGFRRELTRKVAEASAGVSFDVEARPSLSRGFRNQLRAAVAKSTKGIDVKMPVSPVLARNFRRDVLAMGKKALRTARLDVTLTPKLASNFRSEMRRLARTAAAHLPVTIDIHVGTAAALRAKLLRLIREATTVPPLVARVEIVPNLANLRARTQAAIRSVSRTTNLTPGVNTNILRRRLLTDVSSAMTAANRLAKLNIVTNIQRAGARGIDALNTSLTRLRTLSRGVAIGLGAVAVAVGAVGAAGLKSAADLEFTRTGFGIQLDSIERGEKIFRSLVEAAKTSVFQVPDLQGVVNQLIQVDRLSSQMSFSDIIPTLTNITDLGAALDLAPPVLNRIAIALTKIAGRGKLTGEELRSISKNAPALNAIGLIAEDLGVTVPEAFEKIREGAVSSDQAIRVILEGIKKFPGAAGAGLKEVTTTFKGAMSNLPDILRLSFFEAFEKQLPEITKIIAPNGPVIRAFEAAAPAFGRAFVPIARTFFESISDFSPALESLVQVVTPVFVQLGRATGRLGLQLRRAFDNIGPALRDTAESFATLLAGVAPILPILGSFVGLVADGLTSALDGLISGGAVDLLIEFFQGLLDVAEELIPILSAVIEQIGHALLDALEDIDLAQFGDALGLLAQAGGDLLVALAPLIPSVVEIASIFATALAPAIQASIPLIEALITILTPIAEILARMGPGILILVGIAKAAVGLGTGVATVARFVGGLQNLHDTLMGKDGKTGLFGSRAEEFAGRITRGLKVVAGAAAATAAGLSSYFAAASEDVATQVIGIGTAVSSIALAFAVAGPIAGSFAIVATGIGAVFGQAAKEAARVREEVRLTEELARGFQSSFKVTGIDTAGKRIIGIVDQFSKLIDATQTPEGSGPGARGFFGRFNGDVAKSAVLLEESRAMFDSYVESLADKAVQNIMVGNQREIRGFSEEMSEAANNANRDLGPALKRALDAKGLGRNITEIDEVFSRFASGAGIERFKRDLADLGITGKTAALAVSVLGDSVEETISETADITFGLKLDDSVLQAIRQQQQLLEVERLLKTDTQKVSDAFNGFQGAANSATDALRSFRDLQEGDAANADEALLNSINLGKELLSIQEQLFEKEISQSEATAATAKAIRDTAAENEGAIGDLIVRSRGNYADFTREAEQLRFKTLLGLIDSFKNTGLSTEEATIKAKGLVDQVLEIPTRTEFDVAMNDNGTQDALNTLLASLRILDQLKLQEVTVRLRTQTDGGFRFGGPQALGKLVRKPELSLVGEDGPELILPLTKPDRMAALLKEATDAGLLNLPGAQLPVTPTVGQGPGLGFSFAPDPESGREFTKASGEAIADLGDQLTSATDPGLEAWRNNVSLHLDSVVTRMDRFGDQARGNLSGTFGALTGIATTGSASVVGALRTGLTTGTSTVATIVRGYARALATALNPVLEAIGQPKITEFRQGGVNDPRIVPDGAYNVHVFGERGTRGEAYIPFDPKMRSSSRAIADETVRRLGGQAQWFRGGGVTGDTAGVDPEFFRRLDRWSYAVGQPYDIGSGYRSPAEQARLYQRYLAGVPGQAPAAPPGKSMHNFGLASDGPRWGNLGPGNFGLRYPVPGEPWHVEPNEARLWAGMADRAIAIVPLPKTPGAGAYGDLSLTAKKAMEFTYLQALAWAGRQAVAGVPGTLAFSGGSASEAAAAGWARQAMNLTGVGPHWLPGLLTLFRRESGFDPRAINLWDSNARAGFPTQGLGQMHPQTFARYALPGMTDILNPVHNAAAVIRYILDKYLDISNVQQANPSLPPKGYADGAIVHQDQIARVAERNKAEVIIPLTKPYRARQLADASGLTGMIADGGGYHGPQTIVEKVEVNVTPPDAESAEAYAASMGNRMGPAIAAAVEKAVGG